MKATDVRILDVGCGSAKHADAFGIDMRANSQADLVHDLRATPWPLPDNHYTHVHCQDIIEHMADTGAFLHELHRVCAPSARIEIRTPHFSSWYAYNDPTHMHAFGLFFLDHFTTDNSTVSSGGALFRYLDRRYVFWRPYRMMGVAALANRHPQWYERMFCWIFPCQNMLITITPVK